MKVLVAVKRVVDYNARIRVKTDGSGVDLANVKMSINPFDEIAVEEAVRLKEAGVASDVVLVSIGDAAVTEVLRHGFALGADRGIAVSAQTDEPLHIAKILQAIVAQEQPELIILGKQAIDNDCNQVGQMLAALLDYPQATFISKLTVAEDRVEIEREVDAGIESVSMSLPAVLTTDLRLNEPRYVTLPNIMKAKSKPITQTNLAELGVELQPHTQLLCIEEPGKREAGIKVDSVDALMDALKQKGVLL